MIIKTLTCHDVYNLGASLQAYALSKYLTDLGHDVEIIDYKPDYLSGHFRLTGVSNPKYDKPIIRIVYQMLKFPKRFIALHGKRKKAFDSFKKEYLPVGKTRYNSEQELENNPPMADLYIAGSDQIWNTLFKNGNDPAFYLQFVPPTKVKASYAASFATDKLYGEKTEQIRRWLFGLDHISVRERSGLVILRDLGIKEAACVLDPVFLLSKKEWEKMCVPATDDDYLFVYDFDKNNQIKDFAYRIAKQQGYKIFTLQNLGYGDRCYNQVGPKEFISLIMNARCIISNSFHATAFSIIFGKDFWVFNRHENINTRMLDLVNSLELGTRIVGNLSNRIDEKRIDYSKVNRLLSENISLSKDYLDSVMSEVVCND